jgi:hypothetical protein
MGVRQAITGIGAFMMLVLTSPKLAGLIALILPVVVLPLIFGRRERRLSKAAQERIGDLASEQRKRWAVSAPFRPSPRKIAHARVLLPGLKPPCAPHSGAFSPAVC